MSMIPGVRSGLSRVLGAALCCGVLALAGCGDDEEETPSGATCPEGSTLTYESFGRAFMEQYCTRCHSSERTGAARVGAPADDNFDTLDGVLAEAGEIDSEAAAGPNGVNTKMPEGGPFPTEDERRMLGEWLACGAPEN